MDKAAVLCSTEWTATCCLCLSLEFLRLNHFTYSQFKAAKKYCTTFHIRPWMQLQKHFSKPTVPDSFLDQAILDPIMGIELFKSDLSIIFIDTVFHNKGYSVNQLLVHLSGICQGHHQAEAWEVGSAAAGREPLRATGAASSVVALWRVFLGKDVWCVQSTPTWNYSQINISYVLNKNKTKAGPVWDLSSFHQSFETSMKSMNFLSCGDDIHGNLCRKGSSQRESSGLDHFRRQPVSLILWWFKHI